jgi:hypothetical protein
MTEPTKAEINTGSDPESRPTDLMTEVDALDDIASPPDEPFDPGWLFYAAFTSLCIITLAVALDATSLSVALPVSWPLLAASTATKVLILREDEYQKRLVMGE